MYNVINSLRETETHATEPVAYDLKGKSKGKDIPVTGSGDP
jgi:hypothetical protein